MNVENILNGNYQQYLQEKRKIIVKKNGEI